LKKTGMPAFAPSHRPHEIWALVASIRQLPKITPQQYQEMSQAAGLKKTKRQRGIKVTRTSTPSRDGWAEPQHGPPPEAWYLFVPKACRGGPGPDKEG